MRPASLDQLPSAGSPSDINFIASTAPLSSYKRSSFVLVSRVRVKRRIETLWDTDDRIVRQERDRVSGVRTRSRHRNLL